MFIEDYKVLQRQIDKFIWRGCMSESMRSCDVLALFFSTKDRTGERTMKVELNMWQFSNHSPSVGLSTLFPRGKFFVYYLAPCYQKMFHHHDRGCGRYHDPWLVTLLLWQYFISLVSPMQILDRYYPEVLSTSPSIGRQGKALLRQQKKTIPKSSDCAMSMFRSHNYSIEFATRFRLS